MLHSRIIWILLLLLPLQYAVAQQDSKDVVFFNRHFVAEPDSNHVLLYGKPRQVKGNHYQVTFYSFTGQMVGVGNYKGKSFRTRNGEFQYYHRNGQIYLDVNYSHGMLNGIYKEFHNNGVLADSGRMDGNEPVGVWKSWYPNGQLLEIRQFKINSGFRGSHYSTLEGEFVSWFSDGSLKDSGFYKQNEKVGVWIEWLEDGEVRSVGQYIHDWKKRTWRYYDKRGKLIYLRKFKSLQKDRTGELIKIG
ncbi:MAG: hypothetical protein H7Y31_13105 [Chitinophagaceae bacterium]|nr:hypothetical protein [Chitinophagaceae bacterium]